MGRPAQVQPTPAPCSPCVTPSPRLLPSPLRLQRTPQVLSAASFKARGNMIQASLAGGQLVATLNGTAVAPSPRWQVIPGGSLLFPPARRDTQRTLVVHTPGLEITFVQPLVRTRVWRNGRWVWTAVLLDAVEVGVTVLDLAALPTELHGVLAETFVTQRNQPGWQ